MIKRALFAAPVSLALIAAAPLAAQDEGAEAVEAVEEEGAEGEVDMMAGMGALFGELFKVEPLTAEQEARLPTATRIAQKVLPDGMMAQMFNTMMGDMLAPLMELGPPPASSTISSGLGIGSYELDLTDEQMAELASLIDPVWEERGKREMAVFPEIMGQMMGTLEPSMRKVMAELYAIKFEQAELAQLETFFNTDVGAKFARESYAMATDPRVLGASFEVMPQMIGAMGGMEAAMAEATADLPAKREFSSLSRKEKARISELTGLTAEEIEERIAAAAEAETWMEDWDAEAEGEAAEAPEE